MPSAIDVDSFTSVEDEGSLATISSATDGYSSAGVSDSVSAVPSSSVVLEEG